VTDKEAERAIKSLVTLVPRAGSAIRPISGTVRRDTCVNTSSG
jgi:hypothetical protein